MVLALGLAALLMPPPGGVRAAVSNLRLTNNTCSGVTATVAYDGVTGAPTPNSIRFTPFRVDAGGDVALPGEVTVAAPGAAQDVTATLSWSAQASGTTIRIRASQLNNSGGTISSTDTTYACSGVSGTPTPTPTPTPIPAIEREQREGIIRLYQGIGDAVIFKLPNGDVQFYRLVNDQGIFVGTAPYYLMDQLLYQPNQLVGQFRAGDGWRVDLYYIGWNVWRAVYYTPTGAVHTDVRFEYGNPQAGLPPVETGAPGQVLDPRGIPRVYPPTEPLPPPAPVIVVPPPLPIPQLPPAVLAPPPAGPAVSAPSGGLIPASGLSVVAQYSVNVRVAPRADAPRLTALPQGAPLTLVGRDRTGFWVLGVTPRGLYGWVAMQYLSANLAQIFALPVVE